MSMIFEFKRMEDAEAFVREVKERFGLDGRAFADEEVYKHLPLYPFRIELPAALVDRVRPHTDAEATEVRRRFGLRAREIAEEEERHCSELFGKEATCYAIHFLAEQRVEDLHGTIVPTRIFTGENFKDP